jgi:hypothetical protein
MPRSNMLLSFLSAARLLGDGVWSADQNPLGKSKVKETHLFSKKEPTHIWILDGWGEGELVKIKESI